MALELIETLVPLVNIYNHLNLYCFTSRVHGVDCDVDGGVAVEVVAVQDDRDKDSHSNIHRRTSRGCTMLLLPMPPAIAVWLVVMFCAFSSYFQFRVSYCYFYPFDYPKWQKFTPHQ